MFIWGKNFKNNVLKDNIFISGIQKAYPPLFVEFKNIIPDNIDLFPTGNVIDDLQLNENETIKATLLSGANPMVLINPEAVQLSGLELPSNIKYENIKERINLISKNAAKLMKIEPTDALRVAWVSKSASFIDTSGNMINEETIDIVARITANNRIHHAFTGTGAINLTCACLIEGTIANLCLEGNEKQNKNIVHGEVKIGQPGGSMTCEAEVEYDPVKRKWKINQAGLVRTAKLLMEGFVYT